MIYFLRYKAYTDDNNLHLEIIQLYKFLDLSTQSTCVLSHTQNEYLTRGTLLYFYKITCNFKFVLVVVLYGHSYGHS